MQPGEDMAWIETSAGKFTFAELQTADFRGNTDFEDRTLKFCRDWLSGKAEFEIQTSGSTGEPKTVSFTRNQLTASAQLTEAALELTRGCNALVCLDTRYIAGQMMLVRCLWTGMNIIAVEPCSNPFALLPRELKIDFVALVPYQVQAILQSADAYRFNEINTIIIGGASLPVAVRDKLQPFKTNFYATYGMTETISHIALQRLNGKRQDYFHPLKNISVSKDQRGCLEILAPHISPDKIVTNDLVELNADQSFQVVGRWDNVINSGGVKLIPEKIEAKISKAIKGYHAEFFVGGIPDENLGEKLVLVFEGGPQVKAKELIPELTEVLDRFEVPKEILFVREFARTETGKINRKKTLNLLLTR